MNTPTPTSNLPKTITPEQEKQAIEEVKNRIPKNMDNKMAMRWTARLARLLQRPLIAGIVATLCWMKGTPVSRDQLIIGARIAEKAATERKNELEQGISRSNGPRP